MSERGRDLTIVGREAELVAVDEALTSVRSGRPQLLLVGGDAGMGKTSLVRVVVDRASAEGVVVLEGHCLDLRAGSPFGPVVEAIRPLLAAVAEDETRPAARRVARLLSPATETSVTEAGTLLDDLHQVVDEAVRHGPVVLVLEDLHWVDRSTQDLALMLARTVAGPLLLVLTFRTDEMTRRHPFRTALVELGRSPGARRLDLAPLDGSAVRGIVERRTGKPARGDQVADLLARSEGNPLYVEELLAGDPDQVPGPLSDLLLARVDALSAPTRSLLRVASVGGSRIEVDLVGGIAGLESEVRDRLLGEAIDANVVVRRGEHLDFRHGLLREAVYDDLLPGSRPQLHAAFAAALQARLAPSPASSAADLVTLSQLAFHWYAAHHQPAALAASVQAGLAARRYGAAAEAAAHFERVLALWDEVPDAQAAGGMAKAELVLMLGQAIGDQGDLQRWRTMVDEAVGLLEPDGNRLLASRVYAALGSLVGLGVVDSAGSDEPMRLALEYAEGEPTRELAKVLVARAAIHQRRSAYRPAYADAARALEVARAAGCAEEEVAALVGMGFVQMMLGEYRDGIARLEEAVKSAERNGLVGEALFQQGHLAWWLMIAGETERGMSAARRGRASALAAGLPVVAAFCGEQELECLQWRGQFDDSDDLLAEMLRIGMPSYRWRFFRAQMLLERGDAAAALLVQQEILQDLALSAERPSEADVLRQVRIFVILGDVAAALRAAEGLLAVSEGSDSVLVRAAAARAAYEALVAARPTGTDVPAGMAERAAQALRAAGDGLTDEWRGGYFGVALLIARARAHRLAGVPAVDEWRAAAEAAAGLGAGTALEPRLELASELLATGERDEGRVLLVDVWQAARDIGARHVEARAAKLAKRSRVPLPVDAHETIGPLAKLTAREREVLDVLATGATNRAIATRLFISEKTVSVHITSVLAKLGVANRGEAAALVRELRGPDA